MNRSATMVAVAEQILAAPREKHYGYGLCKTTGIKSGTLFPILSRFLEAGWIADGWEDPEEVEGRPPRRYYTLTDAGAQALLTAVTQGKPAARGRARSSLIPGRASS